MNVPKHILQSKADAERTASWSRRPMHVWRGQHLSTAVLVSWLAMDKAAAGARRSAD